MIKVNSSVANEKSKDEGGRRSWYTRPQLAAILVRELPETSPTGIRMPVVRGRFVNPHDELRNLTDLFPGESQLIAAAEHVASALVPSPYGQLLAHNHHMTVTMEKYHQTPVDVRIIARRHEGDIYSRKIILVKTGTDIPVQFGIVRFNFEYVTPAVCDEIIAGDIPLGRVLINHNVLRHIDLGAVLKITAGPELAEHLAMEPGGETYGRLATIFCNQKPAVDLLEVSAPVAGSMG